MVWKGMKVEKERGRLWERMEGCEREEEDEGGKMLNNKMERVVARRERMRQEMNPASSLSRGGTGAAAEERG